jgi:hypothetical protein
LILVLGFLGFGLHFPQVDCDSLDVRLRRR